MIFDTLFALDGNLQLQPQMVDKYTVSKDAMKYSFTLRDGLKFHDGAAGDRRGLRGLAQALGAPGTRWASS